MKTSTRLCVLIVVSAAVLLLGSCGGSSGSQTPPPVDYGIGGTVVNLATGDSVQLQDNGGDTLSVTANGAFTFATKLTSGSSYNVTISAQPTTPAQTCGVTNGTGTATGNVTNVAVDCGHNEWTWMSGANVTNQAGTYGTEGTAASTNVPGAREYAVTWTDTSGNLWLFGGNGYDSAGTLGNLNDLWKYSGGQWTWMDGSNLVNQAGTYGTEGTAAPGNIPGARCCAVSWTDTSGNFWLFGGGGLDSKGNGGSLNDLWKYSGGQWTWMSGSKVVNEVGTYGIEGAAAPGNVPGARYWPVAWADSSGNLWLFGGDGYDSAGTVGSLNDLWEYSGGEWTWMSGSKVVDQPGTYGTQGQPASGNVPGARYFSVSWIDTSGNFWLFGGGGYGYQSGDTGDLNDLWKYSGGEWTWMSGNNFVSGRPGVYGNRGTPASGNVPGGRWGAVAWTDAAGNLWLFGGMGFDSVGGSENNLNDLWKYSAGEWAWMSGSNVANQAGTYGTEGTAAPGNVPGAREVAVSWIDTSGNLWLFGGSGYDFNTKTQWYFNDLWKYEP